MQASDPENRGHGPRSGADAPRPILRRQPATGASPPEGTDAPFAAARLTSLTHELANLLDGSMRCLGLAQRSLDDAAHAAAATPDLARRIGTVHAALRQMSELVRSAMTGVGPDACLGRRPGLVESWTLEEAIGHAADVMTPIAHDAGIDLHLDLDPALAGVHAGAVYAPVAAAIRNAIDAVERTGRGHGNIHLSAQLILDEQNPGGTVVIEIADDGVGPPPLPAGREHLVFELGFSTKRGRIAHPTGEAAVGIGLAMVRDVVTAMGGTAQLLPNAQGDGKGGAILRMSYPVRAASPRSIGGSERC